jgi:hypothetical protein
MTSDIAAAIAAGVTGDSGAASTETTGSPAPFSKNSRHTAGMRSRLSRYSS